MRVYINDLSINEGFPTRDAAVETLLELARLRISEPAIYKFLYCSKSFPFRNAISGESIIQTFSMLKRDEKLLLLQWLTSKGPFIEDDRQEEDDDYFEFNAVDVTEQGLGEAARRIIHGSNSAVYSFTQGAAYDFSLTPLPVTHGLPEAPITTVDVNNVWSIYALQDLLGNEKPVPHSWKDLLTYCREKYKFLSIGSFCETALKPYPFSSNVSDRTIALLSILNTLAQCISDVGVLSHKGHEIVQAHFVGKSARFTDESDENKILFEKEMTFKDPADEKKEIVCYWHGKIKTPQFRIHFEWPVSTPHLKIKVPYIGPKISKK